MRVSVIIPTYNGSRHLPRLFDCLRQAVGAQIAEVLVCDDGSSEDLRAITRRHGHGLPIVYLHQTRRGFRAGAARNLGISASTGEVLLFLDQDVLFLPSFIDLHVRQHRVVSRPRLAIGFRQRVTDDSTTTNFPGAPACMDDHRCQILGRDGDGITTSSMPWYYAYACNFSVSSAYRTERFDESFVGWGNEDLDYAYRLWRKGAEFVCARGATVLHTDEPGMLDPYLNESRGQPADFTSLAINTVRMLAKYPDDELLCAAMRDDLRGFSVISDRCVRKSGCDDVEAVIRWALAKTSSGT